jgi:hypothetical protein
MAATEGSVDTSPAMESKKEQNTPLNGGITPSSIQNRVQRKKELKIKTAEPEHASPMQSLLPPLA